MFFGLLFVSAMRCISWQFLAVVPLIKQVKTLNMVCPQQLGSGRACHIPASYSSSCTAATAIPSPIFSSDICGLRPQYSTVDRFRSSGRLGVINVQKANPKCSVYHSSKTQETSYQEINSKVMDTRTGSLDSADLLKFLNSDAVLKRLTTEEAFLEFLSNELAYVDVQPGMVINCNVKTSKFGNSNYANQYIIDKVLDHPESGFFSFVLVPFKSKRNKQHLLITRGTSYIKSPGMLSKAASNGFYTMDMDITGVAYQYAMWDIFKETIISALSSYDASFTLSGHSLGGVLSARILEILYHNDRNLFEKANVRMFGAPVLARGTVPNIGDKLISFINNRDMLISFPNPLHVTEFKTVKRKIPAVNKNPTQFVKNQMSYHKYAPYIVECLTGDSVEFELINFE